METINWNDFPSRQIAPFMSEEVLTTGFVREDKNAVLAVPDKNIENGAKLA